jgi:glycosyltransferase involved in cell wall biosynthesis
VNIAQFISHFPYPDQFTDPRLVRDYVCSGGEIAAYKLAVNLARLGHSVHVFTSSADGRDSVGTFDRLTVHRYGSRFEVGTTRISPRLLWGPLRERGIEIVHVQHTTPPGGAAGWLYARIRRKPLVVTHHGFERFENYGGPARRFFVFLTANFFVDFLFSQADALIAVSPFFGARSRVLKKYRQKTVCIPNGIDLEEYSTPLSAREARKALGLPENIPLILFVGSFIPRKGVDVLLAAMRRVADVHPAAELVLVGQGLMQDALARQAEALGLGARVRFQGYVGEAARKVLYYRSADVLAVPSVDDLEAFPLVLLEGCAVGCAVAASDLETFKIILRDGYNAVSAKAGDAESLAGAILSILRNAGLKKTLSENSQKSAERFSWEHAAAETEKIFRRCLSAAGTR